MASSSSFHQSPKVYDVFINHRGPDVKQTLALKLYNSLQDARCRAFLDCQEIELGDSIPSTIQQAISSSSVQIALFSPRYAESAWCLNELDLMLQTKALFIPVFYNVKPGELKNTEKGMYAPAFSEFQKKRRHLDDLDKWKKALHSAASFLGYTIDSNETNNDPFKKIVSAVLNEVERRKSLEVAEYPVGLHNLMEAFQLKLQEKRKEDVVNIAGIFGMGGCGKTTLAKHFFNSNRDTYNRSCFLIDVRERSARGEMTSLQTKLLRDLLDENPNKFTSESDGATHLKDRLGRCSSQGFLIVIDDIDEKEQLDPLLFRNSLGSDSLVIITTRDERLLIRANIAVRYKIQGMDIDQGTQLFCRHAFGQPNPAKGYEDLVHRVVKLCGGLPLSLKVLGSQVSGSDKSYWKMVLAKLEKTLPRDIEKRLKISFDALDRDEKQMFMDTACFFIGKERSMALRIWEASGWSAEHSLQTLIDKCLVEVSVSRSRLVLEMHDHLRSLGRDLADADTTTVRLWRPQHLKSLESMGFQNMLKEPNRRWLQSTGGSSMDPKITFFAGSSIDCAAKSTILLWLEFDLEHQSLDSIPSWIPLQNLEYLKGVNGHLKELWKDDIQLSSSSATPLRLGSGAQVPIQLKELLLEDISLGEFPNSLGMLNHLENLVLRFQGSTSNYKTVPWRSLSESLRKLRNLKSLIVKGIPLSGELDLGSSSFEYSAIGCMDSLEDIHISFLEHTSRISISGEICPRLRYLNVFTMKNLIEVDLGLLKGLKGLELCFCRNLNRISGSFGLKELVKLRIDSCSELQELPSLENLSCLEEISLQNCENLQNIPGIEKLEGLKSLYISTGCAGIWNCIQRMKKLPSEITFAIGRAVDGAKSALNAKLFSSVISANAASEIRRDVKGRVEPPLMIPDSLSAIIVCALVESFGSGELRTPITDTPSMSIPSGELMVTMVFGGGTERKYFDPNWALGHADIKKEYMVIVKKGEEKKTLRIFKLIIAKLYKTKRKTRAY